LVQLTEAGPGSPNFEENKVLISFGHNLADDPQDITSSEQSLDFVLFGKKKQGRIC